MKFLNRFLFKKVLISLFCCFVLLKVFTLYFNASFKNITKIQNQIETLTPFSVFSVLFPPTFHKHTLVSGKVDIFDLETKQLLKRISVERMKPFERWMRVARVRKVRLLSRPAFFGIHILKMRKEYSVSRLEKEIDSFFRGKESVIPQRMQHYHVYYLDKFLKPYCLSNRSKVKVNFSLDYYYQEDIKKKNNVRLAIIKDCSDVK